MHDSRDVLTDECPELGFDDHEQVNFLQKTHKNVKNGTRLALTEGLKKVFEALGDLFPELGGLVVEFVLFFS